jgi:3',5'-cyclic AMP phosphodiesterase CpdA
MNKKSITLTKRILSRMFIFCLIFFAFSAWAYGSETERASVLHQWNIFPDGEDVTRLSHVLKLDINIEQNDIAEILAGEGALLEIPFNVAHNSGRRLLAWTDLSGDAGEINGFTFATRENQAAGIVARSALLPPGAQSASVIIPKELLYDETANRAATEIYIILTTDNVDDASTTEGNRGASSRNNVNGINLAAEFDIFNKIILISLVPYICDEEFIFTHISLAPGATPAEIGFAWFTPRGYTNTAILQLVKQSELVNWLMPENPAEFTGVNGTGSSLYDTNKVTVTGLENNTAYAYRVGNGSEWSQIYTFNTQNPDGVYRIIIVSDPQISNNNDAAVWRNTARIAVEKAPDAVFIMIPGDLVDYANDPTEYTGFLSPRELRSYPVNAAPGNHDLEAFMTSQFEPVVYMPLIYQWANRHFIEDGLFSGYNFYFSYGNTLYITINSSIKDTEKHRAFMKEAVASHPDAVWRIANFHHDIYGAGDHAGSGYGDSAAMQSDWSPFLSEFGIDIAFNGHDHVYARSFFIKNDEIIKYQMPAILEQNFSIASPPGAYILPVGTLYLSLSTAGTKFYNPEMQTWVAYTPGRSNVQEYSVMTVDGDSITVQTYRVDTNAMTDSVTIRKTATYADLQSLIPGCEAVVRGDILEPGWLAFQAEIARARAVGSSAATADIHAAYIALYNAYYALETSTDKTALSALVTQTEEKLSTATEGLWAGQYPFGSIAELQLAFDSAFIVYEKRLVAQAETDAAYAQLNSALTRFISLVSDIPMPWVYIHEIKSDGVTVVDLLDWMDDGRSYVLGTESRIRYFTHHTKQEFACDNFGGPRHEPFAPANAAGGRGVSNGHITKTNIGEWIRYELNIKKAGMYKVILGAANTTAVNQKILLRDANQNILAEFIVPANSPLTNGWENALMLEADKEIYLPAGNFTVELFFVNDGVNVNTRNDNPYPSGADVDILTFERTGDTAFARSPNPAIYQLPFIPEIAAGAAPRQRGWGTPDWWDEWGNNGTVPVEILKAATHLVLELAAPLGNSFQMQILSDAIMEWRDNNFSAADAAQLWDGSKLVIPLSRLTNFELWRSMRYSGMINFSYYNTGWDEINLMNAYLILDRGIASEPDASDAAQETVIQETAQSEAEVILPLPGQYTVRPWAATGDSLSVIAGYPWVYGDPEKWRELYEANRTRMPDPNNPHLIYPGFILNIPSIRGEERQGMWNPDRTYVTP